MMVSPDVLHACIRNFAAVDRSLLQRLSTLITQHSIDSTAHVNRQIPREDNRNRDLAIWARETWGPFFWNRRCNRKRNFMLTL